MDACYRNLMQVSEELRLSSVRYDKNIPHQIYIWRWENVGTKINIFLYQSGVGSNARPNLTFSKTLNKIQQAERMHPQCLVDEISKRIYIVCHSHKANRKLTIMQIPVNWDDSYKITISGPTMAKAEHSSFYCHSLFLHPDGSFMRHVGLSTIKEESDFQIEWFALNSANSKVETVACEKVVNEVYAMLVPTWAPIQFSQNGSILILMYGQLPENYEPCLAVLGLHTVPFAHLPDFAVFSLDCARKKLSLIRRLPLVVYQSPQSRLVMATGFLATFMFPIGRAYKYFLFKFGPECSPSLKTQLKNVYIMIAIKSLPESLKGVQPNSSLTFERVRYALPFVSKKYLKIVEEEKRKVSGSVSNIVSRPRSADGNIVCIVRLSDSVEKRINFDLNSYKDYRKCATCGQVEQKKRRNKNNKRISDFKVCRICKDLNFHWQWWAYGSHYCCLTCMKKDWPKHKEMHKRPKLLSKMNETVNLAQMETWKIEK